MALQIVGLVLVFCIIILIDLIGVKSIKKSKKTVSIYFTILIFGFVTSLLLIIDKAPPSPTTYIEKAINIFLPR